MPRLSAEISVWRTLTTKAKDLPTSVPVGHPLIKCHNPAPSEPPLAPLHAENNESLSLRVTPEVLQATFQGTLELAVAGQL